VVGYWQHGTPHGREDHANHVLLDLLYGQPSSWSIEYSQWKDLKPLFLQVAELLGGLHARTAHASMTGHYILTDDYMVQQTTLSDGTTISVNFGITSYEDEKLHLPPKGFQVVYPEGESVKGRVERTIEYLP
jgi:hypothetical protein